MADDVLDRMRAWDRCWPGNVHIESMVDDAIAEIERLREALSEREDATHRQHEAEEYRAHMAFLRSRQ